MKTLLTFSALALVSNMAFAETFQYERQLTSEDLDPNIPSLSQGISNPAKSVQQPRVSLFDTYRGNPDTQVGPVEPDSMPVPRHNHIFTAYDMLIETTPDLEV
ncbi:hypothetical protein [Thiolapillus sp.]|uniref:hypothetical protein n=1 Tax=Thiolapillus sp. TaxID=2017437 RepID=UPI0025DE46C6|nr:hypothetical protein [Thiolapillus sp.]